MDACKKPEPEKSKKGEEGLWPNEIGQKSEGKVPKNTLERLEEWNQDLKF